MPQSSADTLLSIWRELAECYFPHQPEITCYQISWSTRRQKRTLASCNIQQQRVVVARELDTPEHHRWLEPLLYHEMCHAALGKGVERKNGKRLWHGPEFRALEARHPKSAELDGWIKSGGWRRAVRSDRSRNTALKRWGQSKVKR